jgi:hypothetical protein
MKQQGADRNMTAKDVAFFFFLITPGMNAKKIFQLWATHPVLKDYERPDEQWLVVWVEEFVSERNSNNYKGEYIKI